MEVVLDVLNFTNILVSASEVVVEGEVENSSDSDVSSDVDPLTDDFLHHGEEDDGSTLFFLFLNCLWGDFFVFSLMCCCWLRM